MKFSAAATLSLGLMMGVSTPALASGQLPKTVAPVLYTITIEPNASAKTFIGTENVTLVVKEPTSTIRLNAADLAISDVTFDGKKVPFTLLAETQELSVALPTAAKPGKHKMTFAWTGKISDAASGLFAIDYKNPDGSPARMLATQFEAPDARRFAPMWDEPSFKARFRLTAVAPANELAFSNMRAKVSTRKDGKKIFRFDETPVMSSYLLFLGMGDVERKTVMAGKTEIGVITRRGVVDQGDYALASAKRLLTYYNDYFGQPYPLPKLDMIAGPGSSQFFGAMENWGAIFYFEPTLLFDPARATQSGRERIFVVVAHEMAHQWFGDLVTMDWWDDLWLNEGFASWMENKASNDLNPDWFAKASAVAQDREGAIGLDATAATHPIIRKVATVEEIGEAFDSITYQKGQAVIGMIESTLGADAFRAGIRSYMAKYKYKNTQTDQLWAELEKASGKPVVDSAHDFTLQGGVPLISLVGATCSAGQTQVLMSQGRYGLDAPSKVAQTWRVPLTLGVVGGPVSSTIVSGAAPTAVNVQGCGTIVLNRDKGSYLRARYDDAGHAAIVKDFTKLELTDRLGTLGDDFALALSGDQGLDRYLRLGGEVKPDANSLELATVSDQLGTIIGIVEGTPLEAGARAKTVAFLAPVMTRVGFEAQTGESPLITNLRENVVRRLGVNGDAAVAAAARRYVGALASTDTAIPPAIRGPILATYAVNATQAEWDVMLKLTREATNPVVRNGYIQLLGSARDIALANRALELLKGSEFTAPQKSSLLRAISGRHADLAFDFAVANPDLINGFLEASTRSGFIPSLGAGSTDPAMPAKIMAYAEKNLPEASRGGAKRTVALMAVRQQLMDRTRPAIEPWVK